MNVEETLFMQKGREFTRTEPIGFLEVKFEILSENWKENGFEST